MKVAIVSPTAPPAPGGASQWSMQLTRGLRDRGIDATVWSERHPDVEGGQHPWVFRRYPYRAGAPKRDLMAYITYARQQALFVADSIGRFGDADVLLLHASLLYHETSLALATRRMPTVVDLRDPLMPPSIVRRMGPTPLVVSCSASTTAAAAHLGISSVYEIPIPFEAPSLPPTTELPAIPDFAHHRRFVLFTNGVNRAKGIDHAVELTRRLRASGHVDGLLVMGRYREKSDSLDRATMEGWAAHLGPVPNSTVHRLMMRATLVTFLSLGEGLPRAALEALSLGAIPLLPPLEEFQEHVPQFVVHDLDDADSLHGHACWLIEEQPTHSYPLKRHDPSLVAEQYEEVLLDAVSHTRPAARGRS